MANFADITFKRLKEGVESYLRDLYNKAGMAFSPASPQGHLLAAIVELFKLNSLHQRNIVREYDITNPANNNRHVVRSLAVLGGYNPTRAVAASGTLKLQAKPGVDLAQEVKGGRIVLPNRAKLRNESNGLLYSLDLGTDSITCPVTAGGAIYLNVVQGEWLTRTATGTGEGNQSISVSASGAQEVDNHRYEVRVNSQLFTPRVHIHDMLPDEDAYVCKTGLAGGLDVMFGNGYFGRMPPLAAPVQIHYLVTEGAEGNLPNPQPNEFKFIADIHSSQGASVDMAGVFDVTVSTPVQFGADGESVAFTRGVLPFASTNFVLVRPENFVFHLKRLGVFSVVDAYVPTKASQEDMAELKAMAVEGAKAVTKAMALGRMRDKSAVGALQRHASALERTQALLASQSHTSVVHLFLVPDVNVYYGSDETFDYFSVPTDAFLLDDVEKARILQYLQADGTFSLVSDVQIVNPVVRRFVMEVRVSLFKDAIAENVQADIRAAASDYFLACERRDRIPPSDLIRVFEDVHGVDSVDVSFVSEQAEVYHAEYIRKHEAFQVKNGRLPQPGEIKMDDGDPYDPYWSPGVDEQMGDIVLERNELPLIRGGWSDRNGVAFSEQPSANGAGPINIYIHPKRNRDKVRELAQKKPDAKQQLRERLVSSKPVANINRGHSI